MKQNTESIMRVVCAWCKEKIKEEVVEKPQKIEGDFLVSHGICQKCLDEFKKNY